MINFMRQFIFVFILFLSAIGYSQNTSTISGQLIDAEFNNEPLAFASVTIKGTVKETTSNIDGSFSFDNLKPGNYTLVYSFVGYETKEEIVEVNKDNEIVVNVLMTAQTPTLKATVNASSSTNNQTELTSS